MKSWTLTSIGIKEKPGENGQETSCVNTGQDSLQTKNRDSIDRLLDLLVGAICGAFLLAWLERMIALASSR